MKKPFFLSPKINKPWGLWLLAHLTLPLLLLLSIFYTGKVHINTMLFDMLPQSGYSRTVMEADMTFVEKNSRELVILTGAPDFKKAKKGADLLYMEFENSPDFESISCYFDTAAAADFYQYLYNYRFVIAGKKTLALLESGRAGEIAEDALASAFGAFNYIPLDNLEHDPFFLAERQMKEFLLSPLLTGGSVSLKEDVLAAEKDGTWYVLLRLTIASRAASLRPDQNAVGNIYAAASAIKESVPDLEFYFSGIPFHSYESSSGAQKEISLISTITLIIILFLFLYAFRSPLPVFISILTAGVSLGIAAVSALLIFREIHIITFVFGTTLIGTSVDYSVHFFVHWKGNSSLKNGIEIRSHILKSITMSFISTEICFLAFFFARFPILKQFAVFSMTGLASSFLTTLCIYPYLKIPKKENRLFQLFSRKTFLQLKNLSVPQSARTAIIAGLAFIALAFAAFNSSFLKIENDFSSLYTMSASLLESEKRTAQVMDYGFPGWYYIVSGSSPEETLDHEEQLIVRLEKEIAGGNARSVLGTSVFVPSIKRQKKIYNAMKALLPLVPDQFEQLGFSPEYAGQFYREYAAAEKFCLPKDAPSYAGISNLWIGEQGEECYSCVFVFHPAGNETGFRSIAEEFDFVCFINKAKDTGRDLDVLTKTMAVLFISAYIVISVLVFIVYKWKDGLKICSIPIFLILLTLAVLTANKISIGFFSLTALILVFGLGLDYIFYMIDKKHRKAKNLTRLAVILSFFTTLLSFGALALSSFVPVHIFGLTVSAGLGAAFIFAILLQNKDELTESFDRIDKPV